MHIMSIVGARPQFVKLATIAREFEEHPSIRHSIVHTGQHYDQQMSDVFFEELGIPHPDWNLQVGSSSHAHQTGDMMKELETCFEKNKPNVVLAYGDTNSTIAACLVASKLHIPIAHIEAGLRSHNRRMPEEINRVTADHCSDRLYAPSPEGMVNLEKENLLSRAVFTGDVMRDVVEHNRKLAARQSSVLTKLDLAPNDYALLTLHRPVNTEPSALIRILTTLDTLAQSHLPIIFPVHPRTRAVLRDCDRSFSEAIKFTEPLAYLDMLVAVESSRVVLTDSGGLQKEAAFLQTQCITLREETEWVETLEIGANCLVGQSAEKIESAYTRAVNNPFQFSNQTMKKMDQYFGDGHAAKNIVQDILRNFKS